MIKRNKDIVNEIIEISAAASAMDLFVASAAMPVPVTVAIPKAKG